MALHQLIKFKDFVTISLGNALNFGDLKTDGRGFSRSVASNVRGVTAGGEDAPADLIY